MKPLSRPSFAVYLLYFTLAVIVTFPLILNFSTQMIGHSTGDAYEMGHHIWWFKYALQNGQPLFWQTLSGYPEGFSGLSLWANPLQFFPAWLFTFMMPVASAYNLAVLLTMALNGWAMCWVMTRWLAPGDTRLCVPALVAGVVYMTFPTMQGHLFGGHAGLLVAWGAPLYAYALFKLVEAPSRRWLLLTVGFFLIVPGGHTLQAIYVTLPITCLFIVTRLLKGDWRGAGRGIAANLIGGVLLFLFLIPVFGETFADDTYTGDAGYVRFSMDLLAPFTPSFDHPLFGQLDYTHRVLGVNLIEGFAYVGIVATFLGVIAVGSRRAARWWLLLAAVAGVLALGPILKLYDQPVTLQIDQYETYLTAPWAAVYNLPGLSLARTPGRFTFTLALAAAVLAGYGAMTLWTRLGRGRRANVVLFALTLFVMWEYQPSFPYYTVPAAVPDAITNLREEPDIRAVMDMPWGNLLAAKQGLYLQTWHEQPLIAGQVTRRTPVSPAKLTLLERTLNPALLKNEGVDVIILHREYTDTELDSRLRAQIGTPYYEDERFALFRVPESDEGLQVTWQLGDDRAVKSSADSYIFTPSPGWMDLSGTLNARGRRAVLYLNGKLLYRWSLTGETPFTVPLPLDYRGYHTVTVAVEPPCPEIVNPTLQCRMLRVNDLKLTPLSAGPLYEPVELANGIMLAGAYLPPDLVTGNTLPVRLWWKFTASLPPNAVRFIKVLDAQGQSVATLDTVPEALQDTVQAPDDELAERLDIDVSNLSGTYGVYVGWYTLPDVVRFPVLSDVPGANDGLIFLGAVNVK